jgi:hypothetical protein
MSGRILAFVLLSVACTAVAVGAVAAAALRARDGERASERAAAVVRPTVSRLLADDRPFVLFRDLDRQDISKYGRLALTQLEDGGPGERLVTGEDCERVDFAAGRGLCLGNAGPVGFKAKILDGALQQTASMRLAGIPSRTRVSPDGRYGAVTAFVSGHSYADVGQFSTAATLIDLERGKKVGDLERDFTITLDGRPATARDRNFWGVTFSRDSDRFYATMATDGKTYLIEASVSRRTGRVIHENVECPSLSPDEARIAYKKAVGHNPPVWRFHVLELATGPRDPAVGRTAARQQSSALSVGRVDVGDAGGRHRIAAPLACGSGLARRRTQLTQTPATEQA